MLTSWQFEGSQCSSTPTAPRTCIGYFDAIRKTLRVLSELEDNTSEVIQASINNSLNLLAYVVKSSSLKEEHRDPPPSDDQEPCNGTAQYMAIIRELCNERTGEEAAASDGGRVAGRGHSFQLLQETSRFQVMVQFLWPAEIRPGKLQDQDKLLVMIHRKSKVSLIK